MSTAVKQPEQEQVLGAVTTTGWGGGGWVRGKLPGRTRYGITQAVVLNAIAEHPTVCEDVLQGE